MADSITAIVLAAGQGTRMKSKKPKVLNAAAGRPLIDYILDGLKGAGISQIRLVVGHGSHEVRAHVDRAGVSFYEQKTQAGTADAVKSADVDSLQGPVLICNGDHPLIGKEDYGAAIGAFTQGCDLLIVSCEVKKPTGFGRIVRSQKGRIMGIVEEREASASQKQIREINSGLYVAKSEVLKKLLPLIKNNNAKREFYLTDLVDLALENGYTVEVCQLSPRVVRGVNTQVELAMASQALYRQKTRDLMEQGVVIIDPKCTYIDSQVEVGADTVIHPGAMIFGQTKIGSACLVEAYSSIKDSEIADKVEIRWGSIVEKSKIKEGAFIGPYARLRPETVIGEGAHIGNFVELKKTVFGAGAKANHLTYLGDAEIGDETNIGCGTITCNYAVDKKKYKTKIGKKVFVGSDTQFVAPVTIGDGAVIGSGSTITKDVPDRALAVARGKQVIKPDYNKEP